jgi:c-di-GMP-related signal transduction protein
MRRMPWAARKVEPQPEGDAVTTAAVLTDDSATQATKEADASSRDVYVARQPIFDARSNVYGYELLYRDGFENRFTGTNAEQASVSVIANSFFVLGIETLTGHGRAFVNFTRENLLGDLAYVLPRERLVIEVLEDVEADDKVRAACQKLKDAGFMLALDDFTADAPTAPLMDLADLVKVDFMAIPVRERARLAHDLTKMGKVLLAEKVETQSDFDQAIRFGYTYVQGYYFAKPEIHVGRRSSGFRMNRLEIIRELNRDEPNLRIIEDLLNRDPDLTYRLLRYLNSAAFALRDRVADVRRAIMFLGVAGLRAWATVIILADLGADKPFEVVVTSVVRARFCELLGRELNVATSGAELFLMGLFSLLDVLTGQKLDQALADLPLGNETRGALLGEDTSVRPLLDLAYAFEKADWAAAGEIITSHGLDPQGVPSLHFESVEWGNRSTLLK